MKFNLNIKRNNKIFLVMLAFCVIAFMSCAYSAETNDNYIEIGTKAELEAFRDRVNAGETKLSAKLTADIDLAGSEENQWDPIGYRTGSRPKIYQGTFDGQGHKITGLYINGDNDQRWNYKGFFGAVGGHCVIKDLIIAGSVINVNNYSGGICGYYSASGTISNCTNEVNVGGKDYIGGICGYVEGERDGAWRATITNCVNNGKINGKNRTGGIAGHCNYACTITNCKNQGIITGDWIVGGVCGSMELATIISNCANIADVIDREHIIVSGDEDVGGICGMCSDGADVLDCINEGMTAGRENVGGICGCASYATFTNCVNKSGIYGKTSEKSDAVGKLGGICGFVDTAAKIYNCVNEGIVKMASLCRVDYGVGGICGRIEFGGDVKNCFNSGKVIAGTSTGQGGAIAALCRARSGSINISNCGWFGSAAGAVLHIIGEGTTITDTKEYSAAEIPATSAIITLDKLMIGDTKTAVKIYPVKACNIETISNTLASSDTSVATINGYEVAAITKGTTTISGTVSGLFGSATLDLSKSIVVEDPSEKSNFRVVAEQEGGIPGSTITVKLKLLLTDLADLLVKEIKFCVMWYYNWLEVLSAEKSSITGAKDPNIVIRSGMVSFEISNPSGILFNEGQYYDVGTMTLKIDDGTQVGSINDIYISSGTYMLSNGVIKTPATINTDMTVYQPVTVINISSSTSSTTMLVQSTLQLNTEILPATAHTKDITWSSSDETVATVDANGLVTAKEISGKSATVTITASAVDGSGVTGNIQLTVTRPDLTGITFAKKAYRVLAGNSQDLYAELNVVPAIALKPQATAITWTSDNPKITVDANGKVTMANDAENVTGTITAQCQNEQGQTVSCTTTVTTGKVSVNLNLATKLEGRTSGGGTGTNVEQIEVWLYDNANHPLWNGSGTTDANGNVSFEIEAEALEEGKTVKLWIKGERCLAKLLTQTVTLSGSDWNVTMPEALRAADTNADNRVASADFLALRKSYMSREGSPDFNRLADFDANGRIASADFLLLRRNYMARGDNKPQAAVTMLMTAAARKGSTDTAMELLNTETAKVAEEALENSTATDEEQQEEEILAAVQAATNAPLKAASASETSSDSSTNSNESSSSSGGCNAGYGALALLFAIPLIFKKRK